jgi:transposase-like protein
MNEILQAETAEHLGAELREQTDDRREYQNGSYERQLTARAVSLNLEVPRETGPFKPTYSGGTSDRKRHWSPR